MSCSGAKKNPWCSGLPVNYVDVHGGLYCIFHAPANCKAGIEGEFFNRLVFERIRRETRKKGCCDLSGTVFDWDIDFSGLGGEICLDNVSFADAVFKGKVCFAKTSFAGNADFRGVLFCKTADFEDTLFSCPCDFRGAIFREMPSFFDTTFIGFANFLEVTFDDGAFFTWGCFRKGSNFEGASYGGSVILKRPVVA